MLPSTYGEEAAIQILLSLSTLPGLDGYLLTSGLHTHYLFSWFVAVDTRVRLEWSAIVCNSM